MSIYDPRYESMARAELEQLQLERLQALLTRLKRNVRRYREQLGDTRLEALADVARLPMTTPEDLVESFPYGMFAMPLREVIRLHSIMGPQGTPLVLGHTRNDLAQWGRLVARQLVASGVTANDVVQICLGGGIFRGALGYALGAERIESSVIAEEPYHVDAQLAMLQNYRPTMLITTPSNAHDLIRLMDERHVDPQSFHLRTVLLSRPVDEAARDQLRAGLFVTVQSNLGVDQVLDPGLCVQCESGRFHVNEDHFLVETVDGELVITTLCREAMPLLRYRTRVGCAIRREKCPCGRVGAILEPGARLDGRLRVNETPFYESQIAETLAQTRAQGHRFEFQIMDRQILIKIELTGGLFSDMMWPLMEVQREVQTAFLARLGLSTEVTFIAPKRTDH